MLTNPFKGCKWISEFLTIKTHSDNDDTHYAADKLRWYMALTVFNRKVSTPFLLNYFMLRL